MGAAVVVVEHKTGLAVVVEGGGGVVTGAGWVTLKVQLQWHTGAGGGLVVVVVGTVGQVTGGGVVGGAGHSVRGKL